MRDNDGNDQDTMTLRDRFAMAALQGLLACPGVECPLDIFAEVAYKHADAMLVVRAAIPYPDGHTEAVSTHTAEQELADVVAYLVERSAHGFISSAFKIAAKELEDGNHVGAAERAKAGAK